MKSDDKSKQKLMYYIIFLLGSIFLFYMSYIIFIDYTEEKKLERDFGVDVTATIYSIDSYRVKDKTRYSVLISYIDPEGHEYTNELSYYTASMREGADVNITVDERDYNNILDVNGALWGSIITLCMGLVTAYLGGAGIKDYFTT